MRDVLAALQVERRWHLDALAALQGQRRAALGHGVLGLPVLVVTGQDAIDHLGVGLAALLELLRVAIARERVDDGPAQDHAADAGVDGRRARRQRDRRVARIARAHGGEHALLAAARDAHHPDAVGRAAQLARFRLEPADRVIDVGHRRRIRAVRRHAEVQRRHHHAAPRQRLVDRRVVGAIAAIPGAAVQVHDDRERPASARLEEPGEQGLVSMTDVLDVADLDLVAALGVHAGSLSGGRCRRGVGCTSDESSSTPIRRPS